MAYQNDKPSSDAQQPNLLTWSFERQPRHEKPTEGELSRDLHEEQGVETSVCKPTEVVDITQGRVEG